MEGNYYRARRAGESVQVFISRVSSNLDYESCSLLDQLPSVEAVFDYYGLFATDYGTDYWSGVLECITAGDSPQPALAFIKRWSLGAAWSEDVAQAVASRTAGAQ